MADEQAAGTPGATSEGAVTDSGTPTSSQDGSGAATVSAEEIESLRNIREQFLREKENTERIRQENEELRREREERQRYGQGHPPATAYDPSQAAVAEAAQAIQILQDRDPEYARALLAFGTLTQAEFQKRDADLTRREAEARYKRELEAIPSDRKAEVDRIAKAEGLWPSIVDDRVVRRRLEAKEQSLAEQSRKLQEERDRLARGVVRTDAAPAPPATNHNGEITAEQWAQITRDAANGNADARRKVRDYDEGRLKIRSG